MATSQDVKFVGDVKISVVKVKDGYAVSRSDVCDRVFLNPKDDKFYSSHTDAINGVIDIYGKMLDEITRFGKPKTFFSSTKEERDAYFGECNKM